ncbi:hypothetical protein RJZ56_004298, partial [Blastomyces dermatitidis]
MYAGQVTRVGSNATVTSPATPDSVNGSIRKPKHGLRSLGIVLGNRYDFGMMEMSKFSNGICRLGLSDGSRPRESSWGFDVG